MEELVALYARLRLQWTCTGTVPEMLPHVQRQLQNLHVIDLQENGNPKFLDAALKWVFREELEHPTN